MCGIEVLHGGQKSAALFDFPGICYYVRVKPVCNDC